LSFLLTCSVCTCAFSVVLAFFSIAAVRCSDWTVAVPFFPPRVRPCCSSFLPCYPPPCSSVCLGSVR
jgi:hypothetical protein